MSSQAETICRSNIPMKRRQWLLTLSFLLLMIFPATGWSDTETGNPENSDSPTETQINTDAPACPDDGLLPPKTTWIKRMSDPERWDRLQKRMSVGISGAAERVDRFFGDERLEDDNHGTRLKLGLGLRYHKEDKASLVTDIKARVALPSLEDRFHLVLDDSFESDEPGDTGIYSDALKDSEPDTALRYIISRKEDRRVNADLGLRLSSPSQVFGRLRGRYTLPWVLWELQLTQTFYWYTDDGFIETSKMRWSRKIGPDWLLRFTSSLTWEDKEEGWRPSQAITLFKELTTRRGYYFQLYGSWPESPHTREALYRTEFTYRQLIHGKWLFFEISPGIEFPQKTDYEVTPYIQFTVSVVFDENL